MGSNIRKIGRRFCYLNFIWKIGERGYFCEKFERVTAFKLAQKLHFTFP